MTIMSAGLRKFVLTAHVVVSVGLLGSIAAFLALALAGLGSEQEPIIRSAYLAMDLTARFIIVPLAIAALVTGVIQSLGNAWGLFRHYWIVGKLLLTAFATAVLLIKLELIGHGAHLAAEPVLPFVDLRAVGMELAVHAALGLMVLIVPAVLSVYKPWGLTPYGRSRLREVRVPLRQRSPASQSPVLDQAGSVGVRLNSGSISITLRRAHAIGIVVIVLLVHFVVLHFAGFGHGVH